MTIDQFRNHGWTPGQSGAYDGTIYKIASVDFAENLVGLANPLSDEGITWVRCENVILLNAKPNYSIGIAMGIAKPWFIWTENKLSLRDRIKILLGWKIYTRFDSSNGQCSAGCDMRHQITRDKYDAVNWH